MLKAAFKMTIVSVFIMVLMTETTFAQTFFGKPSKKAATPNSSTQGQVLSPSEFKNKVNTLSKQTQSNVNQQLDQKLVKPTPPASPTTQPLVPANPTPPANVPPPTPAYGTSPNVNNPNYGNVANPPNQSSSQTSQPYTGFGTGNTGNTGTNNNQSGSGWNINY